MQQVLYPENKSECQTALFYGSKPMHKQGHQTSNWGRDVHKRGTETKNENSNVEKTEQEIHLLSSILYI